MKHEPIASLHNQSFVIANFELRLIMTKSNFKFKMKCYPCYVRTFQLMCYAFLYVTKKKQKQTMLENNLKGFSPVKYDHLVHQMI